MATLESSPLLDSKKNEKNVPRCSSAKEFMDLLHLAWPIFVTFILQTSIGLVAISFVGKIGTVELAAASLGNMFSNIMGFSVGIGFASAMDTLCSQAYGAGNLKMIGVIAQRAALILTAISLPLGLLWFWSEGLLVAVGQDRDVSRLTGIYMRYQLIGLWPSFMYTVMNKYLQTQGITRPSMVVMVLVSLLNPLITWALIYPFGLGFEGAALAVSVCRILQCLILYSYIMINSLHKETWGGWSFSCLQQWLQFLSLGFPGCVMICAEWWAAELLTLAAGWIGTLELGAQAVLSNTTGFLFAVPLSLTIACSIRVGNKLGMGDSLGAKLVWRASLQLVILVMTSVGVIVLVLRNYFPYLFTNDDNVAAKVSMLLPVVVVYEVLDGIQSVASGALRGCGKQKIGAIGNLFSYYCVGIPISLCLAFLPNARLGLNLQGLWIGNFCGNCAQVLILVTFMLRINWTKEAKEARERVDVEPESTIDTLPPSALTPTAALMHVEIGTPNRERKHVFEKADTVNREFILDGKV